MSARWAIAVLIVLPFYYSAVTYLAIRSYPPMSDRLSRALRTGIQTFLSTAIPLILGKLADIKSIADLSETLKGAGVTVTVMDKVACADMGMGSFLGVARGSSEAQRIVGPVLYVPWTRRSTEATTTVDESGQSRTIRKESDIPIVMLTARGDVMDRVVGLELGADDYLGKPFTRDDGREDKILEIVGLDPVWTKAATAAISPARTWASTTVRSTGTPEKAAASVARARMCAVLTS